MSDLVVLDFDGVGTADEVLTKLRGMQKENLIEDACVVVHTEAGGVYGRLRDQRPVYQGSWRDDTQGILGTFPADQAFDS